MISEKIVLAAVGLTLAMAFGAGAGNAKGNKTTDISFDGFCDGMSITVFTGNQAGEAHTGCEAGRFGAGMEGEVKTANWRSHTLSIGENPNSSGVIYLWGIQYPFVTGGGWGVFSSTDGVNFTEINQGTYTVTGAGAHEIHDGPPSDHPVAK